MRSNNSSDRNEEPAIDPTDEEPTIDPTFEKGMEDEDNAFNDGTPFVTSDNLEMYASGIFERAIVRRLAPNDLANVARIIIWMCADYAATRHSKEGLYWLDDIISNAFEHATEMTREFAKLIRDEEAWVGSPGPEEPPASLQYVWQCPCCQETCESEKVVSVVCRHCCEIHFTEEWFRTHLMVRIQERASDPKGE